ncbi:hypothetical protein OAM15_00570 [Pelagibacteraceae bacterium]|nr:hypothetical protein [Pelagibacteraceae bacterium]
MNKFFCIFCILLFISKTENVLSNNLNYNVNNVEVKSKTNNSFPDSKLVESAFRKAFIAFVNKMLLNKDAKILYKTKNEIIKDLVLTYQIVKNTKNSNNETLSIFNIKFDPKKINIFLAKRGISYADISNITVTLLPILINDKDILLYDENFFYKNWNKQKKVSQEINDESISYNMALENIEDLKYINEIKENISLVEAEKINSFNDIRNYILLIIYSTEGKFKAFIKTTIKNKKIDRNIDLKIYSEDKNRSNEEAIITIKKEITQIWKEQNLIDVNTPSFLDIFLEEEKTDDYLKLKFILDSLDIIDSYSVLEMTNEYSKIRIKYRGKISKVKNKLSEKNIKILIIDNVWNLKIK